MQPVREVYSLLMPVQDGRIIVPRAAVAEVMGYSKPKDRPQNAPDFVLGFVEWQGQKIPLVSYEAARGLGVPELGRRTRIAVVFGMAGRLNPNVFAVVTQGYPYLVRVNENVLQSETLETDDPLVLARVRMANERPYIPDFEQLEVLIAEGLGVAAANEEGVVPAGPVDELDALDIGDEEGADAGMVETDPDTTELPSVDSIDSDSPETNVDLGEVTAFGTDTNYSPELKGLSEALEADDDSAEPAEQDDLASVDLGEVTAFGTDTSYSSELGELSDALQEEDATDAEGDFAIDLSGLELADDNSDSETEEGSGPAGDDGDGGSDSDEIDLSALELDLDDENDDKKD